MENNEELTMDQKLRKLNKLKKDLEDSKSERDKKIGRRDELLKRLKDQFGIDSLDAAIKRIKAIENQVMRRNKAIDTSFNMLMEKYEI